MQGRTFGDRAPPQQQGQHKARGRGPDRRGQQCFGKFQQVNVGIGLRVGVNAAFLNKIIKGFVGAVFAQIAGNGGLQVARGDIGLPQPEVLHQWLAFNAGENTRLHIFDFTDRPQHGKADIGQNIGRQTPEHAMWHFRNLQTEQGGRF